MKEKGYGTVVNLRTTGEEVQPMSPEEERQVEENAELRYLHIPVSGETMGAQLVDQFRDQFPN